MRKLHEYDETDVLGIIEREGWGRPLAPIRRLTRLSGAYQLAFWSLRVYVIAMLAVVVYAFVHGVH